MSRRNISKKRFPETDSVYNSYLVSVLITRILKSGKKTIAKKVVARVRLEHLLSSFVIFVFDE